MNTDQQDIKSYKKRNSSALFFRKGEKNISHPLAFQIAICYL